jgi:hypothetical protein
MNTLSKRLCLLGIAFASVDARSADLASWSAFDSGLHPDYLSKVPSAEANIVWCAWHEGLQHQIMPVNAFRQTCEGMQKASSNKQLVINASNDDISAYLRTMDAYFNDPANGGYKMVFKHLNWVLHHEGRRGEILELLDQGNFTKIRSIYHAEQTHHAHVEFLVYAVSDSGLRSMIDQMRGSSITAY